MRRWVAPVTGRRTSRLGVLHVTWRRILWVSLLFACSGPSGPRRGPPAVDSGGGIRNVTGPRHRPNVLLVIADDLGVDKLRAEFPELTDLPPQPTLDRLSAEGVRFRHAWVTPLCSPTRAALLTGRHPHQLGVGEALPEREPLQMPLGELTLAEALRDAGYATGAFGKWHLSTFSAVNGVDHPNLQGFQRYAGGLGNFNGSAYDAFLKVEDGAVSTRTVYATTDEVDDALAWLADAPEPWFAMVAFHAPHTPLHHPPDALLSAPLPPDAGEYAMWSAMVEAMDSELGRLLDGIPADAAERTTVFFIGDNGTVDDAITPPFRPERAKGSVYEGGVRVPWIVVGPPVGSPGSTSDALVHAVDLFPTVLDLAGVPEPDAGGLRVGHSLVPHLADPDLPSPRTYLHTERFGDFNGPPFRNHRWAVRNDTHKLVGYDGDTGRTTLLYDLATSAVDEGDPLPEPLSPEQALVRDELLAAHDAWMDATPWDPQVEP